MNNILLPTANLPKYIEKDIFIMEEFLFDCYSIGRAIITDGGGDDFVSQLLSHSY